MPVGAAYMQIGDQAALLRASPFDTADIMYSALPGTIFEVVSENEQFVQVATFDDAKVWVLRSAMVPYRGIQPPPIALFGVASPIQAISSVDAKAEIAQLLQADDGVVSGPIVWESTASIETDGPPIRWESEARSTNGPIVWDETTPVTEAIPTSFASAKIRQFVDTDIPRSETVVVAKVPSSAVEDVGTRNPRHIRIRPTYGHLQSAEDWFRYPPRPMSRYPQLDVDGFYEMKISGRDYSPKLSALSATDNRWGVIQRDPVYTKLPSDVLLGSPKFDMRFRFNIDGKLADDLSVHYDIEQEPDFPGKYDVGVKYQKQELTFFHLDAEFQNGEFINYRKSLNGVKYTNYDTNWSAIFAAGKQRSEPKKFESDGNGKRDYNVGVKSLLTDSVKVWVNNALQSEGRDYVVNYFDGVVRFTTVKGPADHIEIVYEFTNPIEDFIPVLSRKNFTGAQYVWKANEVIEKTPRLIRSSESFLVTPSSNPNWIGTTNIALKSTTIVLGTDEVFLNGVPLRRNLDYVVRGRKGVLVLVKRALNMGDAVSVNYSSYDTYDVTEDVIGQDSPGPYYLANGPVLEDSETIVLDRGTLNPAVDYTLNDADGKLQFFYPIKYPSIVTVKYKAIRMDTINSGQGRSTSPFSFGVTYLDEYAKGEEDELLVSVSSENVTFVGSSFSAANNPIAEPETLTLLVNGQLMTYVSGNPTALNTFTVDTYKGLFTVNSSSGSGTAQLSYKYRKSYQTTYIFQAAGPGVNEYINHSTMFNLPDVPLKYNGVRNVRLYDNITNEYIPLTVSRDYIVDYQTNGDDAVSIKFFKKGDIDPNWTAQRYLDSYPASGQRIMLTYDHAPESVPDAGTISQRQFGLTFGAQLTKAWRVDTELSGAENNLTREQLQTEFNGTGQGGAATYSLGFRNIVENSELVFLNEQPQTRDQNYSINYVNGTLRFVNLNPVSTDKIRVVFKYIDPNGQTRAGDSKGYRFASKIATQFQEGPWTVRGDIKSVDRNFSPISPIQVQKGTVSFGGGLEYRRAENQLAAVDYRRYEQYLPPSGVKDNLFKHTDDLGIRAKIQLFNAIDFSQNLRYNLSYSDPSVDGATGNIYSDDASNFSWDTGIAFYMGNSRYLFNRGFSKALTGALDGYDRKATETDSYQLSTDWTFSRLFLLGDTSVKPAFEYSQTTARAFSTASGNETTDIAFSRRIGVGSRFQPMPYMDGGADFSTEEQNSMSNGVSGTPNRVTNYRFDTSYKPFSWINMGGSVANSERFSPLLGQKGQRSNDVRYQVGNFSPPGMLNYLGLKDDNPVVGFLKGSYFTYNYGQSASQENNDLKRINNTSQSVAYNSFSPLPGVSMSRVGYTMEVNSSVDDAQTQTSSQNMNSRNYRLLSGRVDVRIPLWVLDKFGYGISMESKRESQHFDMVAQSATSSRTVMETPFDRRSQNLSFDPGSILIGIPNFFMLDLGSFKVGVDESLYDAVSVQQVDQIVGSSTSTNIAQDNTDQYSLGAEVSLKPLNLIDISGTGRYNRDTFSRNLSQANTGLTYRISQTAGVNVGYSPFSFLGFNGSATFSQADQYRSPSLNLTVDELTSPGIRTNGTLFTDYIFQRRYSATLGTTLTPFSFISFKGSGTLSRLTDEATTTANTSQSTYMEKVGTIGAEFRPLPGLSTAYDYSLRFTDTVGGNSSEGYTGRFLVNYSPIQTDMFRLTMSYTRDDNWGRSLNTLQQTETQKGTGDNIRYSVVDRKDTVEMGSLSLNIILPFKGNPYLENVTITGEGQIKRVTDAFDKDRAALGQQQIGYEISGLVFKATINF